MKDVLKEIVNPEGEYGRIINKELLSQHTQKRTGILGISVPWSKVRHLHIIPSSTASWSHVEAGCYTDETGEWVLLIGDYWHPTDRICVYFRLLLALCGPDLELLHIDGPLAEVLNLQKFTGLRHLILNDLSGLKELRGLQQLSLLEQLTVHKSNIKEIKLPDPQETLSVLNLRNNPQLEKIEGLANASALESLDLNDTQISRIQLTKPMPRLKILQASNTKLADLDFLQMVPNLEVLWLYRSALSRIPSLDHMESLRQLSLSGCPIRSLEGVSFPQSLIVLMLTNCLLTDLNGVVLPNHLKRLSLSGCPIQTLDGVKLPEKIQQLGISDTKLRHLPDSIIALSDLTNLDAENLTLEDLPDWLPQLGLTIGEGTGYGINLEDTDVEKVDMSILDRPQKMIHAWFKARASERARMSAARDPEAPQTYDEIRPLNELKVVFLGDGGAGKSRTIARLLLDGANTEDFPNVSTPGIVIQDRDYALGERTVKVHFWDFGGQDILHSMHRMFLTDRTLYVVMLNVRDGTQTERARYWLHNIRSFAKGTPVLIVLNQIDTNRNASVNQPDLRAMYPELTEVVAMSALEDDAASVQGNLIAALKRQIGAFPTLESPFLPAWSRLKDALGDMEDYYINGDAFCALCAECGVEDDETIRLALLKWFTDLGVSFHYNSSAKLRDYVILRPDWITNAIYTIIFNKSRQVKNGLISHEAIYELLSSDSREIRRAIPEMTYQPREVDYVLDVVRKFRLSFRVGDDSEFIPMLCQADSLPIAGEYEADPCTLEFRMGYEYLPNNVLHRLMVDLRRDLDTSQVWLTGALFRQTSNGLSAVVKTEGDILRIFVRGDDPLHRPHTYLNTIRDALAAIHREMGLTEPESFIVYKKDGSSEEFLYDSLQGSLDSGLTSIYSRVMRRAIPILDILDQSDREVVRRKKKLLADVAEACLQLQGKKIMWAASEDDRNTELRDTLLNKGYDVADQSLLGVGAGRKNAGEVDLLIRGEQKQPWMICEAMNITGAGKTQTEYWNAHLNKLLLNYNPLGLQDLILISYVEADADKFNSLWASYSEHMRWYDPPEVLRRNGTYQETRALPEQYNCLRAARCTYDRGGMPTTVHHYFIRMGL